MRCVRKITGDITWVGVNDRRLAMFEGVYSVPGGVSYNAYLLTDEKTVLFDTVDKAVRQRFLENVAAALDGRPLDYLVVQHVEPDHSAVLEDLVARYPGLKLVCSAKALAFIQQFFGSGADAHIVKEGDTLTTGRHTLHFVMAPMVHWPEVMVTYDSASKILFSADAFGSFGALNGALFADEVNFERDYMDEARRYYANIVGKYGAQVQSLLSKASALDIGMICPLHGFVWRRDLSAILSKYALWSAYEPEEKGVMIAYASVYGNTENAAEILACRLRESGVRTVMFDVSVTPASEIIAAAFQWSHLVFASTTYNAGIFVSMEALINDLTAHNIQNRTAAVIENGSWAATSGSLIREKLETCKNLRILGQTVSIKSGLKAEQLAELEALADALAADFAPPAGAGGAAPGRQDSPPAAIEPAAMFKISYGLFVLTAREGERDNGCIINTAIQITDTPMRVLIAVNKANLTRDMVLNTGVFNLSVLTESAPFSLFQQFGFQSGRDADKFADCGYDDRAANGVRYIPGHTNGVISARVIDAHDYGTHTVFGAEVTQAFTLSGERSVTYQYYFDHIKPKPQPPQEDKRGFVCKICGYVYEGDTLPEDIICPLCKHGARDFEPL
ncbi:MAG: flavin reductase [Oscillospiraceae bacterium]|nr:flavin reductase [Oscillospiraceae bacterium]